MAITKIVFVFLVLLGVNKQSHTQTRNDYEIHSVKAYLFTDHSDYKLDNTDIFSSDIIEDSNNSFFNVVIEHPSSSMLVVIDLVDKSDIGGAEGKVRFTVLGSGERTVFSRTEEFMFMNYEHHYIPFYLYDTGCEILNLKTELIRDEEVVDARTDKITFVCGE